ncbi:MAG: type II secretion system protein [Nautiliaceae bacterium]
MRGFTLIELVFVLIIIGILSAVGAGYIYNSENVVLSDAKLLKQKLLEKRSNALGFIADMSNADEKNSVCLKINKNDLSKDTDKVKYIFKSDNINSPYSELCFDSFGRVYYDDVNISNLIHNEFNISLTYKENTKIITVYPISGYVKVW